MPRYFFNVVAQKGKVMDLEGTELADVEAAHWEATQDARELMSDAILKGRDISDRSMEICDEAGNVVLLVPFRSAYSRG